MCGASQVHEGRGATRVPSRTSRETHRSVDAEVLEAIYLMEGRLLLLRDLVVLRVYGKHSRQQTCGSDVDRSSDFCWRSECPPFALTENRKRCTNRSESTPYSESDSDYTLGKDAIPSRMGSLHWHRKFVVQKVPKARRVKKSPREFREKPAKTSCGNPSKA